MCPVATTSMKTKWSVIYIIYIIKQCTFAVRTSHNWTGINGESSTFSRKSNQVKSANTKVNEGKQSTRGSCGHVYKWHW